MITASNHYAATGDAIAESLSDVDRFINLTKAFAETNDFDVWWRGQANHEWGLVSSLARRLLSASPIDDALLNKLETKLLAEASTWVQDLRAPLYAEPLAKLAYMQHHEIPTRLLDFSRNPWVATFFAAESMDDVDGRLFALFTKKADLLTTTPQGEPWRKYRASEVKVYDATRSGVVFPRLQAQDGVFAVGRLPSTQPHRLCWDELLKKNRSLLADEVRRILSIPFRLVKFDPRTAPAIPTTHTTFGLTFRLHVDKASVRRDLRGQGSGRRVSPPAFSATHEHIYPDATGMVRHSRTIEALKRGILVT